MTLAEQRITIAKQCGWTARQDADGFWRAIHPRGHEAFEKWVSESNVWSAGIPDYLSDLNAMHEAEETLLHNCPASRWETFDNHLADLCGGFARAHATAQQRSHAFLLTHGITP